MNGVPSLGDLINGNNADLQTTVNNLAPLSTSWHAPQANVPVQYQAPQMPSQGVVDSFLGKVGSIGSEAGHLLGGAVTWIGKTLYDAGDSIIHTPANLYHLGADAYDVHSQSTQIDELMNQEKSLTSDWHAGRINDQQYQASLRDIMKQQNDLSGQIQATGVKLSKDGGAAENSVLNTTSAILTVMTGGLTAPLEGIGIKSATEAANYFTSVASRAMLAPAEKTIATAAMDKGFFESLTPALQHAVKDSVYRVLVNSPDNLTATQATKAAVANFALKYPLGYSAINGTSTQIYQDLQQGKYGAAVASLAFNAALLFSGGPIGWALKQGGQAVKDVSVAMGLRPGSVLDELSSYIGDGNRRALAQVAMDKLNSGQKDEVKAMIVAMDSNLKRAQGNSNLAVTNIVDHLENYIGWGSLKDLTHEQVWNNLVSYWKYPEQLEKAKKAGLIEGIARNDPRPIVPGRFTTQDKNNIADMGWEAYRNSYPNSAAANNTNLNRQITNIETAFKSDPEARRKAIMAIPTQIGLDGVPKELADKMAKDGYVAIIPKSHNLPVVPFSEGSKALATTATEGEFFVRASAPVPILSSLGSMLVSAGLSPEMATLRTYQMFKDNFVQNMDSKVLEQYGSKLATAKEAKQAVKQAQVAVGGYSKEELAFMKKQGITPELLDKASVVGGETDATASLSSQMEENVKAMSQEPTTHSTADFILKKLRNYMQQPTRGGIMLGETRVRAPLTDIRQLTIKDIQVALEVDKATAQEIANGIMQAHLNMPREIVGLGNRLMDYNYKYNPLAASYARVQGAARFTFNPFFRNLRLPFKAEFLAQGKANGKFLTIPGTNWLGKALFSGRYKEFDGIIKALKEGKLLPGGLGDEAADYAGTADMLKLGDHYPKNALYPVASLVSDMARRAGMDTGTFISKYPQEVSDAATTILSYDRNNSFLHSPLIKTLNFAFFPARFNVKVATIMAQTLAKQDPLVQFAVVKGLMNADTFFTSPQGQAWYSKNSDIIGLFKYISPVATLSEVAQVLGTHGTAISAYGELGGLPFGWIPALMDSLGITNFGQPYVNPTTGVIAKDYIPVTSRGRVEAAIEDVIQSLFSYPGATVGLPSKSKLSSEIAKGLAKGTSSSNVDFKQVTPTLSPEDQQFQRVVMQLHGGSPTGVPNTYNEIQPTTTVPASPSPITQPTPRPVSSKSAGKKKKSEFTPELLPGQTALGQLP